MPHILEDAGFADRLVNIFLLRRPRAAIASYYRLDSKVSSDEIGILAQWQHFQGLRHQGRNAIVIRSEDVRRDPQKAIGAMWDAVGLPSAVHAFDWRRRDVPEDWKQVSGWHGQVLQSRGLRRWTRMPSSVKPKPSTHSTRQPRILPVTSKRIWRPMTRFLNSGSRWNNFPNFQVNHSLSFHMDLKACNMRCEMRQSHYIERMQITGRRTRSRIPSR